MKLQQLFLAFVAGVFLTLLTAAPACADYVEVRQVAVIRADHSASSAEIGRAAPGERFALVESQRRQGYYNIALADGRRVWIHASRVRRRAGALAGAPLMNAPADRMAVHYIDVGQGAAAIVEFPCAAIMIDAGAQDADAVERLMAYVARFFDRRTDLNRQFATIFVTHTHVDHNRGLRRIVETYDVGAYVHNGILRGSGRQNANWMVGASNPRRMSMHNRPVADSEVVGQNLAGLRDRYIDAVSCAGVDPEIRVLSGAHEENPGWTNDDYENGNNQSLVIRIDYDQSSFLFTGDMEEPALETLVEYYSPEPSRLDADVYLVGHHGSYNGTTYSLLSALSPEIAVISMGPSNDHARWTAWAYGHPRRPAIDLLLNSLTRTRSPAREVPVADAVKRFRNMRISDAIYATGWDGDIVITADAHRHYEVTTSR